MKKMIEKFAWGGYKEFSLNLNGKKQGESKYFDQNGKILEISHFDNGKLVGKLVQYNAFFNFKSLETKYKDDIEYGIRRMFKIYNQSEGEILESLTQMKNFETHGIKIEFK